MRDINEMTVTDAVKATFDSNENERLQFIIHRLIEHLHDFARETKLTQAEWIQGLNFLYDCGKISTPERHEFILLSDVLGLSAIVDMLNTKGGGTENSNLGPFYLENVEHMPLGSDIAKDNEGVIILSNGIVRDTLGNPIKNAIVDTWQADGAGMYPIQEEDRDSYELRGVFETDDQGRYYYTTVMPKPYTVPYDGPVGSLLTSANRHAWRTSHLHYIISAENMRPVTTEVFFEGDEYLDSDAVFGVRKSLIGKVQRVSADAEIEYELERRPDARIDFDFVLAPAN